MDRKGDPAEIMINLKAVFDNLSTTDARCDRAAVTEDAKGYETAQVSILAINYL